MTLVRQPIQDSHPRAFSTVLFGYGRFEFIAFWANWLQRTTTTTNHSPLKLRVGQR
jgi:hypothetical protein